MRDKVNKCGQSPGKDQVIAIVTFSIINIMFDAVWHWSNKSHLHRYRYVWSSDNYNPFIEPMAQAGRQVAFINVIMMEALEQCE